ncbi:MAG: heme NO-binding domain-containing protein [Pseudodesulfovibrio sp.]|nr:heme NO-binding domain-containing protein [Pseudodesulfovibrio sp.]
MLTGPFCRIFALGLILCGVFAGSMYTGGWVAFGIGLGCALVVTVVAAILISRPEARLSKALDALAENGDPETVLCQIDKSSLGNSIFSIAKVMSETQRLKCLYEGSLKGLGNPALLCDVEGHILLATQSMFGLLKKPGSQVLGHTVSKAFYNKDGVSITEKVLRNRKAIEEVVDLDLWDGRVVPVHIFANLVHDHDGEIVGGVSSFIDLTEQTGQRLEVEKQRERMARAGEHVSGLASHLASASELLSAAADDQAQGAQKQRNQTVSVATAMEEMTATVIEVAQNATGTSEAADQAHESATEGVTMVSRAVDAINKVAESAGHLEREVGELDSQAEEIGRIISVINEIADQTNLLALNAAIEAARAGDAGRGFAVVADEVRKLAEKTMTATKEVEEAIGTIQTRSRNATASMRQTAEQVAESTDLSNRAGESLQHIMESIKGMVSRVAQIATAAEQQSVAAEEINSSIEEIADIASEADEAAGQTASATRDLAGLAQELLNVSQEFRDGRGDVDLCEAEGDMVGILPKLVQDYVQKTYGDEIYNAMQEKLEHPVFLPTGRYPDQVLMQMVEYASRQVGISKRDFFLDLGKFTVVLFDELFPGQFTDESLKSFYLRLNELHVQFSKKQPGIDPPSFTYEDKGSDLFMNYRSKRGLFDYFEGILLGAAERKGEKVSISIKPFDNEVARAEIVFHGKA